MIRLSALAVLGLFFTCGAAPAQTIIKISPDRSTVTATNDRGTATSTIVRDGQGGGTITTRYQPNNAYKPMGSGGSYQPMGSSKQRAFSTRTESNVVMAGLVPACGPKPLDLSNKLITFGAAP